MIATLFQLLSFPLCPCSGHQLGAAPASPSSRHPHGPAHGPSPAPTAAAAGVFALPARSAVHRLPGRKRAGFTMLLCAGTAAAAGAADSEAEAADPAADPHR